ncbi:MAG: radical SAM protein [Bacteroidales bacterium]|nr:radical SAM protein [Bacteroidales bacterium]
MAVNSFQIEPDRLKRFIDIHVPVEACTLRCHYCYITHHRLFANKLPTFKYDVETFRKGLSKERLGGTCLLNFCGGGETLLPPELPKYIRAVLEEGHYAMIVTNATVNKAFDEIAQFPKELLERLFFKFSYHYLQLKERNLFDRFFNNIRKVRDAGASFTLEATPSDELIPHIKDMQQLAIKEVGAIPHVTVARNEKDMSKIGMLTHLSREDYYKTWNTFNSNLFDYKFSIFGKKRKEFCHAGDWTLYLDMGTGFLNQCYKSLYRQNIFDDITKPIKFKPIGCNCLQPHCFNGHAWLALGTIPELQAPNYGELRNKICTDGTEWLKPKMKLFMEQKVFENNIEYTPIKKFFVNMSMAFRKIPYVSAHFIYDTCKKLVQK